MILARRFFCRAFFRLIEKSCNVFLYNVKENLRAFDNSLKMEIDKSFFCGKRYDSSGDFVDIRRKDFRGLEQKSAICLRLRNSVRFGEISIFRARIELNEERRFYHSQKINAFFFLPFTADFVAAVFERHRNSVRRGPIRRLFQPLSKSGQFLRHFFARVEISAHVHLFVLSVPKRIILDYHSNVIINAHAHFV